MQGKKHDAGKPLAGLLEQDFPRALKLVAEAATYGAKKYSRSNWLLVPDAKTRYLDAKVRHQLEGNIQERDEESGLLHRAHEAWNCLALLELEAREREDFWQSWLSWESWD